MRLATLYMVLVPCGAALSIDRWLEERRGQDVLDLVPNIVQRMVQIQLVVIYMHSGWEKFHGSAWRGGDALYYALSNGQYQRSSALLDAVVSSHIGQWLATLGTWITLGWETLFGFLVLYRPTRNIALVTGLLVHLGIGLTLGVGTFTWIMIWCYQAWIPERFWTKLRPTGPRT